MSENKDYYSILGIERNASESDIKKAYRKLAAKYHPDKFATKSDQEKKEAEEKFKEINEANSVLSDPEKKRNYDQFGDPNGPSMNNYDPFSGFNPFGGFDMEDYMNNFQQRAPQKRKGESLQVYVDIDLEDVLTDCEKTISFQRKTRCTHCNGTGNTSGKLDTCTHCNGTGRIRTKTQQGYMTMINESVCPHCNGMGKISTGPKCTHCQGNGYDLQTVTQKIKIPKGVDTGMSMCSHGDGHESLDGGPNGDLYITIRVKEHKKFERDGNNLVMELPLTLEEAWCGCEKVIECLDGKSIRITIHELTENNKYLRIRDKGLPNISKHMMTRNVKESMGSLLVHITYIMPKSLSKKQKELLKEFYKN